MLAPTKAKIDADYTLEELAAAWRVAKADEQAANKRRLDIEALMLLKCPAVKTEGTDDLIAGSFSVKIKRAFARKVDSEMLSIVFEELPESVLKCFSWEAKLSVAELRKLSKADAAIAAGYLETKPAKPSIEVTPIEKEAA